MNNLELGFTGVFAVEDTLSDSELSDVVQKTLLLPSDGTEASEAIILEGDSERICSFLEMAKVAGSYWKMETSEIERHRANYEAGGAIWIRQTFVSLKNQSHAFRDYQLPYTYRFRVFR